MPIVSRLKTWLRYVPTLTQSESGSLRMFMLAVPMKRPPSSGCQTGTGKLLRSIASPSTMFSKIGPVSTSTGATGLRSLRAPRQKFSSPSWLAASGGSPRVTAWRAGVPLQLTITRWPLG